MTPDPTPQHPQPATEEELSLDVLDEVAGGTGILDLPVNMSFN